MKKNKIKNVLQESEGEIWVVSYADMMTLLFGFFVILYSFSTMDEKKLSDFGKEISETLNDKEKKKPSDAPQIDQERKMKAMQLLVGVLNLGNSVEEATEEIERVMSGQKSMKAAKEMIEKKLGSADAEDGLVSEILNHDKRRNELDLILPGSTLFQPGSAELNYQAKQKIRSLAQALIVVNDVTEIEITGHTDKDKPNESRFRDNWALSAARARSVAKELMRHGIKAGSLKVSAKGDTAPLYPEVDKFGRPIPQNKAKNRRVHIVVRTLKG